MNRSFDASLSAYVSDSFHTIAKLKPVYLARRKQRNNFWVRLSLLNRLGVSHVLSRQELKCYPFTTSTLHSPVLYPALSPTFKRTSRTVHCQQSIQCAPLWPLSSLLPRLTPLKLVATFDRRCRCLKLRYNSGTRIKESLAVVCTRYQPISELRVPKRGL